MRSFHHVASSLFNSAINAPVTHSRLERRSPGAGRATGRSGPTSRHGRATRRRTRAAYGRASPACCGTRSAHGSTGATFRCTYTAHGSIATFRGTRAELRECRAAYGPAHYGRPAYRGAAGRGACERRPDRAGTWCAASRTVCFGFIAAERRDPRGARERTTCAAAI